MKMGGGPGEAKREPTCNLQDTDFTDSHRFDVVHKELTADERK